MFWRRLLVFVIAAGMLFSRPVPEAAAGAAAAALCNKAQFVADISVPDGSTVVPGAVFTKIWRFKNIGTCTWTTAYSLVFDNGTQMAGASPVNLPKAVAPGKTVDLAATLAAPSEPGNYRGYWKLADAAGGRFGLGTNGDAAFWVDVAVQDSSIVAFDLVAFAPYAQWKSGAGPLPYPGTSGDARGYAQRLDYLVTEDGAFTSAPSLLTVPQTKTDGNIQAVYPAFTVQKGDRFQALVGCEQGSACYVTYRLDYINAAGATRNFWTRREMNDGRVYTANLDLSPLAGQSVRFVLTILATGSPTGDRAIWAAPRVVRTVPPATPVPPVVPPEITPTATPFGNPPPIVPSACDKAAFVADLTVPDGTLFAPGAAFTKTWRLKNTGKCTWTTSYRATFYSGEQMGAPTTVDMPRAVRPGETLDLTINMVAPQSSGLHRGDWVLSNAEGVLFGTGSPAVNTFWLQVNVAGGTALGSGYDFSANACSAQWRNGAVDLPCPGTDGDANGFVIRQDAPHMEDGSTATLSGLLVAPRNRLDGYIQGIYPAFTVQPGDRFQSMIGCEFGAKCYVTFRLDYMNASGTVRTLASWRERNEGRFFIVDQDLSSLAGQSVRFILALSATGLPAGDRAIWGAPRIQPRVVVLPSTPTPTPSPTSPPPGDDWLTYSNAVHGVQFRYPAQGVISSPTDDSVRIDLPFTPGTNLREKWVEFQAFPNTGTCHTPFAYGNIPQNHETVVINGITFLKEFWLDGITGQTYDWVSYTTLNGETCLSLGFALHSYNPGAQATPLVIFDKNAESVVFGQILGTFTLGITPTPSHTPTPTPPPLGEDWLTGVADHIRFKYPAGSQIVEQSATHLKIQLPIVLGTNLREKYLDVLITDNPVTCNSRPSGSQPQTAENVTINGVSFLKETGGDGAAGSLYEWVAYSSERGNVCASLSFVLHSNNPGVFPTPPALFDKAYESIVFGQIINSFIWLIPPTFTPETPTITPSPTPLPPHADWLIYDNSVYKFSFRYPKEGQIDNPMDNYVRINLPFTPGTNLAGKYLQSYVTENVSPCRSPLATLSMLESSETVTLNGVTFLKESGSEGGAGNMYQWTAYSTARESTCVSLNFMLHSLNPGNFETPPVVFDAAAEKQVFDQIVATFAWSPTATITPTDTPMPSPLPDLVIGWMRIELRNPSCLQLGDGLGGRVQILNNGSAAAGSFVVRFGESEQTVPGLAPGESTILFFPNYMYTMGSVTTVLDPAGQVAESNETNNSRTDTPAIPTAPLPCPESPTPGVLIGPYAVALLGQDVLPIHQDASLGSPVIGSFPPDTVNIMRTGWNLGADGIGWVQVVRPDGGLGWVDFKYLSEYVSHDAFCADGRIPALIGQIRDAVAGSNGIQFAQRVSPKHGVAVNLWRNAAPMNYTNFTAQSIFADGTQVNWGSSEGAGGPGETGTFAQIVQPKLAEVLNSPYQLSCDDPANAGMFPRAWPYTNIHYYAVIKPGETNILDWRVWLFGFEYVDGNPYLFSTIYYVWAP